MRNPEIFRYRRGRAVLSRSRRLVLRLAGWVADLVRVALALLGVGALALIYAAFFALPIAFVWLVLHLLGSPW